MAIAQCIRDSILGLARGECAATYSTSNYSTSYDDYIMQHFAQQTQWMQHLFAQAGNPIDMALFREEIAASYRFYSDNSNIITYEEASQLCYRSVNTLQRWKREGRCPGAWVKIGAANMINKDKLLEQID
jgi:hypothetical protein